jgi:hypothetical protein
VVIISPSTPKLRPQTPAFYRSYFLKASSVFRQAGVGLVYLPWIPVLEAFANLLVVADLLVNTVGHIDITTTDV